MYIYIGQVIALAVLISGTISQTPHGKDSSVCTTISPSSVTPVVQKPNISNQFQCRVEVVIKNKNKTEQMHEYFDNVNNRGYIRQTDMSLRLDAWYNYDTNEIIGYYPDVPASTPGRCFVQDLSTSDQRFMFGYKTGSGGKGHIFSAAGALHFGDRGINEVYKGRTVVRDIQVDWWRSCQYWANMDATMIVDWYFTAQNMWNSAVGIQVPVQAHVTGVSYLNGKHYFEHYYNFFDFKPYLDSTENQVFETPSGVQCSGRKLTKPLPVVPNDAFSFTMEILDMKTPRLSFMKETYYYSQKLVMYEYTPQTGDFFPYGMNDLIEIHDFNTGVAYVTDRARGNCSYRPIEGSGFDDRSSGPNTVRIRNSREMFYLDVKNVSYEGVKTNRDIDCDTWVAARTDYPFNFPTNSTWEWYYATTQWTEINAGQESGSIPVQFRMSMPDLGLEYQYNIYNFKKSKPDILKFDISGCYEFGQRRKFQFMLQAPDVVKGRISLNSEAFKYNLLQAIINATGLTPIRVADLQFLVAHKIAITFELLDVAPSIGNVKTPRQEVPLAIAADTLARNIQNNQFVVMFTGGPFKDGIKLMADPSSMVEITYSHDTTTAVTTEITTEPQETTVSSSALTTPLKISSSLSHSKMPVSSKRSTSRVATKPSASKVTSKLPASKVTSKLPASKVATKPSASKVTTKPSPSKVATKPSASKVTSKLTTASPKFNSATSKTSGPSTTGVEVKGPKAQSSDKSTRALSIAGVVIGTLVAAILAVLLVVYLKRSGRIRVPGQNTPMGIDNVAYSSANSQIQLNGDH